MRIGKTRRMAKPNKDTEDTIQTQIIPPHKKNYWGLNSNFRSLIVDHLSSLDAIADLFASTEQRIVNQNKYL